MTLHNGIWKDFDTSEVSYPSEASNDYFEIEDQSFWFSWRNDIIYNAVLKYSDQNLMFDIGGGNGIVASFLCKNGYKTVLVEPSIDACINAKKRGLNHIINSSIDRNHFYPESVPNVGLFDVLEHIKDQGKILVKIHEILVLEGKLFLTVPAFNLLWSDEDNYAGHFRRYRMKELRKIIENHGFEIIFSTYFFSFLFFPVLLLRAIPSKLRIYNMEMQKSKIHHKTNSQIKWFVDLLMKRELKKFNSEQTLKYGSSILLVAKKK